MSKILRQKGLTYCVFFIKTQGLVTTIKVLQLSPTSIKTVFKFVFEDTPDAAESSRDNQVGLNQTKVTANQIFTSKDL
jgi:hypothetical protein